MTKQLLHTGLQAVMTNRAYFRPHFIKGFVVVFVLLIFFFSFGSGPVQSLGHKRYGAATDLESNIANSTLGVRQSIQQSNGRKTDTGLFCSLEKSTSSTCRPEQIAVIRSF